MSEVEHFADSEEWAELDFRCEPQIVTGPRRAVFGDIYPAGCSPRCWAGHIPGYDVLHTRPRFDAEWIAALKKLSAAKYAEQYLCKWDLTDGR